MHLTKKNAVLRGAVALLFAIVAIIRLVAGDVLMGLVFLAVALVFAVAGILIPRLHSDKPRKDE